MERIIVLCFSPSPVRKTPWAKTWRFLPDAGVISRCDNVLFAKADLLCGQWLRVQLFGPAIEVQNDLPQCVAFLYVFNADHAARNHEGARDARGFWIVGKLLARGGGSLRFGIGSEA